MKALNQNGEIVEIEGFETQHLEVCSVCACADFNLLWVKDQFNYVCCNNCGLVWVTPQLTDQAVKKIYETGFDSKLDSHPLEPSLAKHKAYLVSFEKYRQTTRLLDVGCFTGNFLWAAREAGWEVQGTEISEEAINYARNKRGLDVYKHNFIDGLGPFEADTYDVITLFDVIEHVSNPVANLEVLLKLLRPGGLLLLDTPNFNSPLRWVLEKKWSIFFPWHRYYFTQGSLSHLLVAAGFEIKRITTVGLSPFSVDNVYQHTLIGNGGRPKATLTAKLITPAINLSKRILDKGSIPCFGLLSLMNIHLGSKLIVFAVRD